MCDRDRERERERERESEREYDKCSAFSNAFEINLYLT